MSKRKKIFCIVDDEKWSLTKTINLQEILKHRPCSEILIEVIKAMPTKFLLQELDPEILIRRGEEYKFKNFMRKLMSIEGLGWDISNFLYDWNFIKFERMTKKEEERAYRNMRRKELRKKAKRK